MHGEPAQRRPEITSELDRAIVALVFHGTAPIPPYPAVALRIEELVRGTDFGLIDLANVVSADQALAAEVLRCANSAVYRRGKPVVSLTQAMTRLGARQVVALAMSSGLAAHAHAPGPLASLRRLIWIESLASAVVCQELAPLCDLQHEEAYALGLLHDFGKLVVASCLETILASRGPAQARPLQEWAGLVERHHVTLGLVMAERWSLPAPVKEVIFAHHGAPGGGAPEPRGVALVQAADRVVELLGALPRVTSADLADVPLLGSAAERDGLAAVLERIPEFVAAFEAPPGAAPHAPSLVAPAGADALARPVSLPVTVTLAQRRRVYAASTIGPRALWMTGDEPLPETRLLEAVLGDGASAFRAWTLTRACRAAHGRYEIELQPYALNGEARSRWDALAAEDARARAIA